MREKKAMCLSCMTAALLWSFSWGKSEILFYFFLKTSNSGVCNLSVCKSDVKKTNHDLIETSWLEAPPLFYAAVAHTCASRSPLKPSGSDKGSVPKHRSLLFSVISHPNKPNSANLGSEPSTILLSTWSKQQTDIWDLEQLCDLG